MRTDGPDGLALGAVDGVPLQNPHRPIEDARRWARGAREKLEAVGARRAIVVGLGLGYHVAALLDEHAANGLPGTAGWTAGPCAPITA